jgi:hypothetical protein
MVVLRYFDTERASRGAAGEMSRFIIEFSGKIH